jgi:hypothetical protein
MGQISLKLPVGPGSHFLTLAIDYQNHKLKGIPFKTMIQ